MFTEFPEARTTAVTRLRLTRTPGGAVRLRGGGGVFRAMLLARDAHGARVQVVPSRMLLLAGDDVALEISVDAGLRLDLTETGGTIAHDMRGGSASWRTSVEVGAGATFTHHTWPWVSSAGSDVVRHTSVALDVGAKAVLRETLVLGRHGEAPGRLVAHTHVTRDGRPVLAEELHSTDLACADLALAGAVSHRVLDQVMALGPLPVPARSAADVVEGAPTRLDLASGDTLWRSLAQDAHHAAGALDRLFAHLTGEREWSVVDTERAPSVDN
ncbi:urease accessory protein UreD [Nocardioides yefusunii]|uniref:Urease accessory protein UreD n=1 Tax=Nocardioides yefusunii TaxID=2500546 RepID=A0ABW1QZV8_9ACTN|nr:urease accessory protein UreD [Nocardioides yefusunii]